VGLANEVREKLRVEWVDPSDPSRGFLYLYLSPEDYESLQALAEKEGAVLIKADPRPAPRPGPDGGPGEVQWVLSDVIGAEDGLGVECLSGSGAIASAYCKAFR